MLTARQLQTLRRAPREPNRVRRAMKMAKLTQEQLAEHIGIEQTRISRVCNGRYSRLPLDTARVFSSFFGCSVDDLFPESHEAVAS